MVMFDGICSDASYVLRTKDETILRQKFLPLLLQCDSFWDFFEENKSGSVNYLMNWKELQKYTFDIPELVEQDRICDAIWQIEQLRQEYRKLLVITDQMVEGRFIQIIGDPYENPYKWEPKKIGDVCRFEGGSQPPRSSFIYEPKDGYVRLIQIRDYKTDEYLTYIPEKSTKKFCDENDIMIGRYGPPIFQILRGLKGAYNVALMKAVPVGINREYLRFFLSRQDLLHHLERFQQRTAGQAGIDMEELKNYPCPLPPQEKQMLLVEIVKQANNMKESVNTALNELDVLQKRIMKKYVEGE